MPVHRERQRRDERGTKRSEFLPNDDRDNAQHRCAKDGEGGPLMPHHHQIREDPNAGQKADRPGQQTQASVVTGSLLLLVGQYETQLVRCRVGDLSKVLEITLWHRGYLRAPASK